MFKVFKGIFMAIQPVNSVKTNTYNKYNLVKYTGYGALGFGAVSVIQASRHKIKSHKFFAGLSILSVLAHVGIIEYFKHKK